MVAAEQVGVVVNERGEPLDVGVVDGVAVAPESRSTSTRLRQPFGDPRHG